MTFIDHLEDPAAKSEGKESNKDSCKFSLTRDPSQRTRFVIGKGTWVEVSFAFLV